MKDDGDVEQAYRWQVVEEPAESRDCALHLFEAEHGFHILLLLTQPALRLGSTASPHKRPLGGSLGTAARWLEGTLGRPIQQPPPLLGPLHLQQVDARCSKAVDGDRNVVARGRTPIEFKRCAQWCSLLARSSTTLLCCYCWCTAVKFKYVLTRRVNLPLRFQGCYHSREMM